MPFNFGSMFNRKSLPPVRFDNFRALNDPNLEVEDPTEDISVSQPSPRLGIMDYYDKAKSPFEDSFREYRNNAPKRENYQPGKLGRLGAILSGLSTGLRGGNGYSAAREIVDQPYNQAMEDYGREGQNLNLEVQLDNERFNRAGKLANDARDIRNEDRDYDLKAKSLAEQVANGKMNRKVAEKQYGMMGFERIDDQTTGHTYWKNPYTGESHDLGKTLETPEEKRTSEMNLFRGKSQIEFGNSKALANLNNDADMARTNRQGEINVDLINERGKVATEQKKKQLEDKIRLEPKSALTENWRKLQQASATDTDLFNYYEIGPDGSVRPVNAGDLNKFNIVKNLLGSGSAPGGVNNDPLGIRR